MLLMPKRIQDNDILKFSPNIITDKKIAISSNHNARLEELIVDSKNKTITKNSFTGYLSTNNNIEVCNKMQVVSDMNTGETISYNLSSLMPSYDNNYNMSQNIGFFYSDKDLNLKSYDLHSYDKRYVNDLIGDSKYITDFDYINAAIYGVENLLQVDYGDLVSVLEMFFTQWSFNIPFVSNIIIDTERRSFNIPKFTYFQKIISEEIAMNLYATFAKELSSLCEFMFDLFNNVYKRKFRILIHHTPFVTVIKIKDTDNKEISLDFNVSASDHLKAMVNNAVSCKWYCNNDSLNVITDKTHNRDITFDVLDTIDYINSNDIF